MNRATKETEAGRRYLELQRKARHAGRPTDELIQLYALEGFLDRLAHSAYVDGFVLKGAVLLAAFDARRLTRDIDLAAHDLENSAAHMLSLIREITVTASVRLLYVLVVTERDTRRLIHVNVTAHPTAGWTLRQLREALGCQDRHKLLLHDRDGSFTSHLEKSIRNLGVRVLKSPTRWPKTNANCERVTGTIRRECLDWLIALSESHLRSILKSWTTHYNGARPHMVPGPGAPGPPAGLPPTSKLKSRHRLPEGAAIRAKAVLGGLHHEYSLAPTTA